MDAHTKRIMILIGVVIVIAMLMGFRLETKMLRTDAGSVESRAAFFYDHLIAYSVSAMNLISEPNCVNELENNFLLLLPEYKYMLVVSVLLTGLILSMSISAKR